MNRQENILKLKNEVFDICVIGAGASGAGVALDATLRGLKVAIIDRGDFCSETSSKSTKLIHGGVRYLEQAFKQLDPGHLKQVKHGLAERKYLLNIAPHLTEPLGIITPVFSWIEGLYYTFGLKMYGWFAPKDRIPRAEWLTKKETIALCPELNPKINSSVMYYDGQIDDARFTVALVSAANEKSAVVANYVGLKKFEKSQEGKLSTAVVFDNISKEEFLIKSKIFINCTGPFADSVRRMANPDEVDRIKPSKGAHIIIAKKFFNSPKAMLIPKTKDGRLVFVIPFKSEIMVGTTDTPYSELEVEPLTDSDEADFLLETLEPFLKTVPLKSEIKSGFGGIRPLLTPKKSSTNETKGLLRDHEIEIDKTSGLISLLGGKWTTYRLMSEDTMNVVAPLLHNSSPCLTKEYKITGAQNDSFNKDKVFLTHKNIGATTLEHLWSTYGDQMEKVLDVAQQEKEYCEKIHPNYVFIKAEIVYCCRFEMISKPRDFTARRLRFELLDWNATQASIQTIANIMAKELNWNTDRLNEEISAYTEQINEFNSEIFTK